MMIMNCGQCVTGLDLSEVPAQLRERILQFHRVLDAPDNFSTTPRSEDTTTTRRFYPLAGLQEDDETSLGDKKPAAPEPLELQTDLFRFSDRLSPPPPDSPGGGSSLPVQNILERMRESQSEMRRRLRQEWQQFQRWRRRQRRRRRMRRRIMKMLQRKLEKRFGPLPPGQWELIQQNSVFRTTKRIIRKKIRRLMRRKMRKRKRKFAGKDGGKTKDRKGIGEGRRKRKEKKKRRRLQQKNSEK